MWRTQCAPKAEARRKPLALGPRCALVVRFIACIQRRFLDVPVVPCRSARNGRLSTSIPGFALYGASAASRTPELSAGPKKRSKRCESRLKMSLAAAALATFRSAANPAANCRYVRRRACGRRLGAVRGRGTFATSDEAGRAKGVWSQGQESGVEQSGESTGESKRESSRGLCRPGESPQVDRVQEFTFRDSPVCQSPIVNQNVNQHVNKSADSMPRCPPQRPSRCHVA